MPTRSVPKRRPPLEKTWAASGTGRERASRGPPVKRHASRTPPPAAALRSSGATVRETSVGRLAATLVEMESTCPTLRPSARSARATVPARAQCRRAEGPPLRRCHVSDPPSLRYRASVARPSR
eukprot:scaffold110113_cov29-Tisochrysis_lutea.AAC.1